MQAPTPNAGSTAPKKKPTRAKKLSTTQPQQSPQPAWLVKIRKLFTAPKLPAWAVFILLAAQQIPDWKARYDFWLDFAKSLGGYVGAMAIVIASPFFDLSLLVSAILWLIFVGEPKKGVQRHPSLTAVGWGIFGFSLAAIVITVGNGAIEGYIQKQISDRDIQLQQKYMSHPIYWKLTDLQKKIITAEIDKINEKDKFPIIIQCLPDSSSRTFAQSLVKPFYEKKWNITNDCIFNSVLPDLVGLYIAVAKDTPITEGVPKNAKLIADMFNKAGISFQWGYDAINSLKKDDFLIIVGNPP